MLFIENSYLKEFESQVQKIENNSIVLEQTAFYAKSGGQPGDVGRRARLLNRRLGCVVDQHGLDRCGPNRTVEVRLVLGAARREVRIRCPVILENLDLGLVHV